MPKRIYPVVIAALIVSLTAVLICRSRAAEPETAAGLPFPNDTGPAQIDVSSYPKAIQADYAVVARRCSQCHTLARMINSQNLQLTLDEQKGARVHEPELFLDEKIWRVSDGVWYDYVARMHTKPGASFRIRASDFDKIMEFLVYDSKVRKMGDNRDAWRAQRQALLDDFRKNNPKRYDELFGR